MCKESMREAYGAALAELGGRNADVVVLDADVSNSTRTIYFARAHPERFFNFGIAEGNMMAAAAGLAACGKIPFANTFSFLTATRAADPVRSLIAANALNVKIVGSYAGLSDAKDGASHQSICDLAAMRSFPNMTVLVAADATETRQAVEAAAQHEGPVYLRLSREELPVLFDERHPFEIGRGNVLRPGRHVTLFATGYMVHKSLAAAGLLAGEGIEAEVIELHTLKPLDAELIVSSLKKTGAAVSVEEHSIIGGFGSAIAETIARQWTAPLEMVGIRDTFAESGEYEALLSKYGMDVDHIVAAVRRGLRRKDEG
jgi:transketolase